MAEFNPYSSSEEDEIDDAVAVDDYELAGRAVRLGAVLLDGIIISIPTWIIVAVFAFGVFEIRFVGGTFASPQDQLIFSAIFILSTIATYFAFNAYLLSKSGQTIGKMACKIKIIKDDGTIPSLIDSFFKRHLLNTLFQAIPIVGGFYALIDCLLIFRENRKCLHDDIAGTLVVRDKKKRRKRVDSDVEDEDNEEEDEEEIDRGMAMILPVGRSGWAIASGYLALFSILIVPAPLALLTGILGVMEMRRNPKKMGMGRAIFGIVMGGLGTAFLLFVLVIFGLDLMRRNGLM